MKKTDIRVQVTRKVLRESLVALMKTKSILNISVREICEAAGVSRSTFYTYCKDQYELLGQMEEEILDELNKLIQRHAPTGDMPPAKELALLLEDALQYIASNSNSVQVFLSENGASDFQKKFSKYIIVHVRQLKNAKNSSLIDEETLNYCSVFIRDGCTGIIQEWLKNGMNTSVHDMAKLFTKLVRGVLG
ncbi:TetR family transcriptional regulator [Spirochaetia bacterium]|nr:TetR family transcriptional regulator [Spirochaetia bacterium]GHU35279.1 TetR family transcriptional regulator [Spirochaetia bacterium]